jgi:transcriptional regulator with XRE-family HTH domain
MIICLGETIRNLRISKGITQEKFGYEMGVSAQAVSRWENGATYPDITMLPTIADYFDVTLDALMGRCKELESKERDNFFQKVYQMRDNGQLTQIEEAYAVMLHKHPNDVYLLHGKAWFLYSQFKKSKDLTVAKEIISLCNKINCYNKPDMQCGANALLVRVYARTGEIEKAKEIANNLPSFEVGRELLIAECLHGTDKNKHYRYIIKRLEEKIALYKSKIDK